jgi:hypothetical protein
VRISTVNTLGITISPPMCSGKINAAVLMTCLSADSVRNRQMNACRGAR